MKGENSNTISLTVADIQNRIFKESPFAYWLCLNVNNFPSI